MLLDTCLCIIFLTIGDIHTLKNNAVSYKQREFYFGLVDILKTK